MSLATFKLYRYQLLPIDRHTDDLYDGRTVSQLVEQKNDLFARTLPYLHQHRHRGQDLSVKIQDLGRDAFLLNIAPRRPLMRETADFRVEQVENWPHISAFILNRPDEQVIAVQDRPSAFASTDTVVKILVGATRQSLSKIGLRLHTERQFRESVFWDLVHEYGDRITWVDFEFITPNMANISANLSDALKGLAKNTNSAQANLQLRADSASALDLDSGDATIRGLVDYTSQGGGDISIKVRGLRKVIHTSNSVREIHLDDLQLSASPEQITGILRELLK